MNIFPFFRFKKKPSPAPQSQSGPITPKHMDNSVKVLRHFYNERGFQCYASFFQHWGGWVTAGHVLTDAQHNWPDFTDYQTDYIWPDGLDAAIKGCQLPTSPPPQPLLGQRVKALGFPAGSRQLETRHGHVYLERGTGSGTWIVHIETPDEPVVTGMSGGPVIDADSGEPIGILITRNSPADLNSDRDPDESCDFVSLRAVYDAITKAGAVA